MMTMDACVHAALLLLFVSCRISQGWSASTALSSVKLAQRQLVNRPDEVMVTSLSFREKEDGHSSLQHPEWVTNYLQSSQSGAPQLPTREGASLQCYFEMLGFLDYPRKSMIDNINGTAQLAQSQLTSKVDCTYRNTFVQMSLEATSIPLAYYCPIYDSSICGDVARVSNGSNTVNYILVTKRASKEYMTAISANIYQHTDLFDTSPSTAGLAGATHEQKVAVCLVLPYVSSEFVQRGILVEHIRWYHDVLGFKVIVYDRNGDHHKLLKINGFFNESAALARDYHDYTVLELQNGKIRSGKQILDTDQDKILTLTHCRMEARAMYNIQSVLVLDSDEFLYCADPHANEEDTESRALVNYQRQSMQSLLNSAVKNNINQLSFTRFSPLYIGTDFRSCMNFAIQRKSKSLFSCFAPISQRRGNYLPKSLMVNYMCPRANTHESCIDLPKPNECTCNISWPHIDKCFVIHVRGKPLLPAKEKARMDSSVESGKRLELSAIMRDLPRPSVPSLNIKKNNTPKKIPPAKGIKKKGKKKKKNFV